MDRTTLFSLPLALAVLIAAEKADASADYPQAIRDKALLAYLPECTLCHADADGSDGTVATDFAHTLWALGMRGGDVDSLGRALDKDRARKWDTDGDGVSDTDELIAHTDPSGPALSGFPPPENGCSVGAVHGGERARGSAWTAAIATVAVAASRLRRRRDTRAPSQFRRLR